MSFTIEKLAESYAENHPLVKAQPEQLTVRRRIEYDAKVYGFNLSTIGTIVALAAAIFYHSFLGMGISWIFNQGRLAFMRSVEVTGLQPASLNPDLLHRVANISPKKREEEIRAYLDINDEKWEVFACRLFDFKLWMNWTPRA